MSGAKFRYNAIKEDEIMMLHDGVDIDDAPKLKRRRLDTEEEEELERMEYLEAEARKVFDVNGKVFDYGKKKSTDLTENKEVTLPKPMDNHTECRYEVIKNKVMKSFRD